MSRPDKNEAWDVLRPATALPRSCSFGGRSGKPRRSRSRFPGVGILLPMLVLFLLLCSPPARGEEGVSITPTRISVSLHPGESIPVEVTLINHGTQGLLLLPRVLEVLEGDGEVPVLEESGRCRWVEPEGQELFLEPSSRQAFTFRLSLGPDVAQGTYRFAMAFVPHREKTGTIAFTGGLAALLELEVLPNPPAPGGSLLPYIFIAIGVFVVILFFALVFHEAKRRKAETPGQA